MSNLSEVAAPAEWHRLFAAWFSEASASGSVTEANAMQLATADGAGRPSVRTVLMKSFDTDGLVFYTNYNSAKGDDLAANPYAAAVFAWLPQERQVRFSGPVEKVPRQETEQYFATRPRGSQIGAWASPQSAVLASRDELDNALDAAALRFGDDEIEPPPHWGGYLLMPEAVEFWQGRDDRLHDRVRYRHSDEGWVTERLAP